MNPADNPTVVAENVFQPLLSPNGALAIYWTGRMELVGGNWGFSQGGTPVLAEHRPLDDEAEATFPNARQLFSDLTIDQQAFVSAAITWGLDGDAFAVSETVWQGDDQGTTALYPDVNRVYFGHATDGRGLTEGHALDPNDLPEGWSVIDVKVSPTGHHLLVMVEEPRAGDLAEPTARLLLITRNTGQVADVVEDVASDGGPWVGPAVFDASIEVDSEAETP